MSAAKPITILMADDDADDRQLTKEAFDESRLANDLRFVEDGEELLDYLKRRGKYADPASSPRPGLILLDLNMPRKDGREALREIKADSERKCIRIVILTTSKAEEDIYRSYNLSAASYMTKPVTFAGRVDVVRTRGRNSGEGGRGVRLPGHGPGRPPDARAGDPLRPPAMPGRGASEAGPRRAGGGGRRADRRAGRRQSGPPGRGRRASSGRAGGR